MSDFDQPKNFNAQLPAPCTVYTRAIVDITSISFTAEKSRQLPLENERNNELVNYGPNPCKLYCAMYPQYFA